MSKRIIASVTLFAFLSLGAPVVAAPAGSAHGNAQNILVESSSGDVTVRDLGSLTASALPLNKSIKVGDNSHLTLRFNNGNRIKLASNSEFKVTGESEVYLVSGKTLVSANTDVSVQTFKADTVATQGEFVVEASPSGTELQTISGDAHLALKTQGATPSFSKLSDLPLLAQRALENFQAALELQSVGEVGLVDTEIDLSDAEEIPDVNIEDAAPDQDMETPDQLAQNTDEDEDEGAGDQEYEKAPDSDGDGVPDGEEGVNWAWVTIPGIGVIAVVIALASDNGDGDSNPSPSAP